MECCYYHDVYVVVGRGGLRGEKEETGKTVTLSGVFCFFKW